MTTNEECLIFGLVHDILGIETPEPIHVVRDSRKRIPRLGSSWREFNNGGNPRGMYWEGIFYINADTASPSLRQTGNTYIHLLMGTSLGLKHEEKEVRRRLHRKMKENLIG